MADLICTETGHFELRGSVNFNNVIDLCDSGCKHIEASAMATLCIGLAEVEQSTSACLGLLIAWLRCAKQYSKEIDYHDAPDFLRSMAAVNGVNKIIFAE
jgi:ABC-type transporter Mla MlaB component